MRVLPNPSASICQLFHFVNVLLSPRSYHDGEAQDYRSSLTDMVGSVRVAMMASSLSPSTLAADALITVLCCIPLS